MATMPAMSQRVPDIFRIDPYRANGHFIMDPQVFDSLELDHVGVDIIATPHGEEPSNGTVIKTLTLDRQNPWKRISGAELDAEPAGSFFHYRVRGYDLLNDVVFDEEPARWNGDSSYVACTQTCNGNNYAWLLTNYSNYTNTLQTIYLDNAPFCFYVPISKWDDFKQTQNPYNIGLTAWSTYENGGTHADCFRVDEIPPGAREINGEPVIPGHVGHQGWAIQKKKGPWLNLYDWSDHQVGTGQICVSDGENLVNYFNSAASVQQNIANLPGNPGPLACPNGLLSQIFVDGPGGELALGCEWIELINHAANVDIDGNVDIMEVVLYVLSCREGGEGFDWPPTPAPSTGLSGVGGVQINKWSGKEGPILGVSVPTPSTEGGPIDPKLIPVKKALLEPGLYELVILMKNGQIIRHFEELKQSVTVGASFDSFVQATIYPVPVKETHFAIDFDLLAPMNIRLTIVDNNGMSYYQRQLEFELGGKNKHVVRMNTRWPNGVYHAVLGYSDGSSGSRSFVVDY